jgi:hypothetical protein
MLAAAKFEWQSPKSQDAPSPRSGHTLTCTANNTHYMFGGVTKEAKGPTSDMYKVREHAAAHRKRARQRGIVCCRFNPSI